jgi:hypothetical protein
LGLLIKLVSKFYVCDIQTPGKIEVGGGGCGAGENMKVWSEERMCREDDKKPPQQSESRAYMVVEMKMVLEMIMRRAV